MSRLIYQYMLVLLIASLVTGIIAAQDSTEITYQLSWVHEYSAAPFYLAEANGHFADAGLKVNLRAGGFQEGKFVDGLAAVLDGSAQFGALDGSTLLQARAEGKPVVAIATITQRSPFSLISLADDHILTPQDLVGKTVAITDGGARMVYDTLLLSQGIDLSTVNTIPRETFGIDPLVNGEVDVLGGWIINEGVQLEEAGLEANFMLMSDYAVDTYDFVIFTTEEMIATNPDIVESFLTALTLGLRDLIDDPQRAAELALTYNGDLDEDEQLHRVLAMIPLINIPGNDPGVMDPVVWDITHQMLLDFNILSEPIDLDSAYDVSFLDAIYEN